MEKADKTIIFDLGGVVFTDGTQHAIDTISKDYEIPEAEVKHIFKGAIGTEYREGKITVEEFWDKAKEHRGITVDSSILQNIWLSGYEKISQTEVIIDKLRQEGYELLFLSDNVQERVDYLSKEYRSLLGRFEDGKLKGGKFKDGVFSHIAGVRKPNPAIYQMALDKSSNKAQDCIYIDDKAELLDPAKALGMSTIHFQTADKLLLALRKMGINI